MTQPFALDARAAQIPRPVWIWGTLDALAAALWSGPTAAFLAALAIELGAGGSQLGLLLALNTLLANGLQLYGAQWTRRGRTGQRVYVAAVLSRGSWLLAGAIPALLATTGRPGMGLLVFLALLIVSSVATAAANPAMGARLQPGGHGISACGPAGSIGRRAAGNPAPVVPAATAEVLPAPTGTHRHPPAPTGNRHGEHATPARRPAAPARRRQRQTCSARAAPPP